MSTNFDPDSELMRRVRQGDREAFASLVDKYRQPVIALIARILNDPHEAEDLAQNVFVQAYKAADRYEVTARFSTWLFTIARNACLNELRRRSRHPTESMDVESPDAETPARQFEDVAQLKPTEQTLQRELQAKVLEALAQLPENQRTAILLCQQSDLSYEDIAKVLGCSISATKSLIHRGREVLRQRLKPYLSTGEWSGKG